MGDVIADSQPDHALEGPAKAANKWSQLNRNVQTQQGKKILRELATRNSNLENSLKSGITKRTLRFYDHVGYASISSRILALPEEAERRGVCEA